MPTRNKEEPSTTVDGDALGILEWVSIVRPEADQPRTSQGAPGGGGRKKKKQKRIIHQPATIATTTVSIITTAQR